MCVVGFAAIVAAASGSAWSGGGPLGIDHKLMYDNSGIWARSVQHGVLYTLVGGEVVGAVWEGGETRLGKTFWESIDASLIGAASSEALKRVFTRARPDQTDSPNDWFQGSRRESFPSGEVTAVSAIVAPFVFTYGSEYPAIYLLELLPLYDAIARMKAQAHWQTDVLAGYALGTGAGYFANKHYNPFVLSIMPHSVVVGLRRQW